jgi:hypothetical protein
MQVAGFTIYEGMPADVIALAPDRDEGAAAAWKLDRASRYAIVYLYAGMKWTFHSPALEGIGSCRAGHEQAGTGTAAGRTISCD